MQKWKLHDKRFIKDTSGRLIAVVENEKYAKLIQLLPELVEYVMVLSDIVDTKCFREKIRKVLDHEND